MIEPGDIITLRPSAFEVELCEPRAEWSAKYRYEDSFDYVALWFRNMDQAGDRANTLFGSSESRVLRIEYSEDGQPFEVFTDLFRVLVPLAVEKGEISVRKPDQTPLKTWRADTETINDLEFFEQEYLKGTFTILERETNKHATYRLGFYSMKREGSGQRKTSCAINANSLHNHTQATRSTKNFRPLLQSYPIKRHDFPSYEKTLTPRSTCSHCMHLGAQSV